MTSATVAMKRGIASGSPALRLGFSSPIDMVLNGVSGCDLKRDRSLVECRPSVAAVRILGEGCIDEVHVDIEMHS